MITPLQVGQQYREEVPPRRRVNLIEIIGLDADYVRYKASEGRMASYKVARNRFEGLIAGGVFIPVPVIPPQAQIEEQGFTIRRLQAENGVLVQQLERLKRQLSFIAEKIKP